MTDRVTIDEVSRNVWRLPGRGARLIVDLDAIEGNVRAIRSSISPQSQVLAVVKANGYGTGAFEASRAALAGGARWLGVATVREGITLRTHGITSGILVLGPTMAAEASSCLHHQISLTIGSGQQLETLLQALPVYAGQSLGVHMKIDTGMHRFGVEPEHAVKTAQRISNDKRMHLQGVFTHFARADEHDPAPTLRQGERFNQTVEAIQQHGIDVGLTHASNSAATLQFRSLDFDMVRPGICVYGVRPDTQVELFPGMKSALRIEAMIQRVSDIPAGDEVGYGGTFQATDRTRTALLSFGYADGYRRNLSGNSWAGFRGEKLKEIGRISMDQTVFELSSECSAGYGDVVRIVGDGAWGEPTLEELALLAGTIPYELMTGLGQRLPLFHHRGIEVVAYDNE